MNNFVYVWTEDDLRLSGNHYGVDDKHTGVLIIHGMSGNIIENYWGNILGEVLQEEGYGCIYSHNRGYNHINDITTKEVNQQNTHKSVRIGAVYEKFEDSVFDIDAWYKYMLSLGYKNLVLVGHSLGCNKVIHYIHKKNPKNLSGVILLSPPDMVANGKESGHSKVYERQLAEAKDNVAKGQLKKLLTDILWGWYYLSSQTFLDMLVDGCPADNLPIMRNPDSFPELLSLKVPVLVLMGEYDDIVVRSLQEDMDLLREKACNTVSFTKVFLQGASHTYDNRENELSEEILKWLKLQKF
jgi:pimeloyl-ACP methyl ester carboxylesterase